MIKILKAPILAQLIFLATLVAATVLAVLAFIPLESNAVVVEAVRKNVDEVVVGDDVPAQDDDELVIPLTKNKTYIIDGAILIDFTGTGDQRIAFTSPAGSTIDLTYIDSKGVVVDTATGSGVLEISGAEAQYIVGTNLRRRPILISGTIEMGSTSGDLTFQWGHYKSSGDDAATTTVEAGSFLRADQI